MSQTKKLRGKVVSENDQSAVSKATITIKNGKSFIADDSGRFTIDVPAGKFKFNGIASIGFAQKQITVDASDDNIINTTY